MRQPKLTPTWRLWSGWRRASCALRAEPAGDGGL
jgi:hypothetical protein